MTNKVGAVLFVPSDKNIYDALLSHKIKQRDLIDFLLSRGFFIPENTEKEKLVEFIATLTLDYHDYIWITKRLENLNKKEKITSSSIESAFTIDDIEVACTEVKEALAIFGDSITLSKTKSSIVLQVHYIDVDFTKTELCQRTTKKCEITLQVTESNLIIKRPANDKSEEIYQKLKSVLEDQKKDILTEVKVSLEEFPIAEARSFFFQTLLESIDGVKFDNVSSVAVHRIPVSDFNTEDIDEDSEESLNSQLGCYINKAMLSGQGVLNSKEFMQLHGDHFFISKIVWTVIEDMIEGIKFEIEAEFGNPNLCTDFKYLVRGAYNYNKTSKGHNITRRSLSFLENQQYTEMVRKASEIAYEAVKARYNMENKEDENKMDTV